MARAIHRLTVRVIAQTKAPGQYHDGAGLYLSINRNGAKAWTFCFMLNGRSREMGLGPLRTIGLAEAREAARAARALLLQKIDPIEARKGTRAASANGKKTFADCAAEYLSAHKAEWTDQHGEQWKNTLAQYASKVFGERAVELIDTPLVLRALIQIWSEKTETAKRVRQRIELVLDYAKSVGYRTGENPARWEGHLELSLAEPSKIQKVEHHPALPYKLLPGFITQLQNEKGVAARALEFMILTATRTNEVQGATLSEFDLEAKHWTISAERMKMQNELRVPLCDRAIQIVSEMQAHSGGGRPFLFPGGKKDQPMSSNAMLALLKRMNDNPVKWRDEKSGRPITPHGFRATFATYFENESSYPYDLREACIAHKVKSSTTAAYQRGDLLVRRRAIMEDWQRYALNPTPGPTTVTSINAQAA